MYSTREKYGQNVISRLQKLVTMRIRIPKYPRHLRFKPPNLRHIVYQGYKLDAGCQGAINRVLTYCRYTHITVWYFVLQTT
jgi:hypothetical protein